MSGEGVGFGLAGQAGCPPAIEARLTCEAPKEAGNRLRGPGSGRKCGVFDATKLPRKGVPGLFERVACRNHPAPPPHSIRDQ